MCVTATVGTWNLIYTSNHFTRHVISNYCPFTHFLFIYLEEFMHYERNATKVERALHSSIERSFELLFHFDKYLATDNDHGDWN
jgi:hypothetical protein